MTDEPPTTEADPRFPSGKWGGFYTCHGFTEKHPMELLLTFANGTMSGEGRDAVGEFLVSGRYHTDNGVCNFRKQYVARHAVEYSGFNEGKGIWGTWEIRAAAKGGFHIWPEGMTTAGEDALAAEEEIPYDPANEAPVTDEELVPAAA